MIKTGLESDGVAVVVGLEGKNFKLYSNRSLEEMEKTGTKNDPFRENYTPIHLEEISKLGFPMIYSNPTKNPEDIVNEVQNAVKKSKKIVLVGNGDFNFFAKASILTLLETLKSEGYEFLLTTKFEGSYKEPEKIPYQPRFLLEKAGCVLLDEKKFQELTTTEFSVEK